MGQGQWQNAFLNYCRIFTLNTATEKKKGISVVRKGKSGAEEIAQMMSDFRNTPPLEIAGSKVVFIKDYKTLQMKNVITGEVSELTMPATRMYCNISPKMAPKFRFALREQSLKIKFYIEVRGEMKSRADYNAADAAANVKIEAVRASLGV